MKTNRQPKFFLFVLIIIFLFACTPQDKAPVPAPPVESQVATSETMDAEFTLKTIAEKGKLAYLGVGGNIDGVVNPDLNVKQGDLVRIVLINGDGMPHDLFLPDFDTGTEYVKRINEQTEIIFEVNGKQPAEYVYYCTVIGHRKAGQEGKLIVAKP